MNKILLSILIPTYNRKKNIMANLEMLSSYIDKLKCCPEVEIVISNNCSTDGTLIELEKFCKRKIIKCKVYNQGSNIGLEKNALFCLKEAGGVFSMFLGDDDYININYLKKVLDYLRQDEGVTCILPNPYAIDNTFKKLSESRDKIQEDKIYLPESNRIDLMFKAHQLSGLVLKTEGTLESYLEKIGNNIYPFMYFAAYNIKRGKTIHISNFPVQVTASNSKDWSYGDDGLITDIIQNIAMIAESQKQKFDLEKIFLKQNKWRYSRYMRNPLPFLKIVFSSERYSRKLRGYIVLLLFRNSITSTVKAFIKWNIGLFGFEIEQRKIVKIRQGEV